jgi:peroxiredoxin
MFNVGLWVSLAAVLPLSVGLAAPEFEAVSQEGRRISLAALRGQGPVMLVFLRGFG